MKLSESDRKSIVEKVGGSPHDTALAVNCIAAFCTAVRVANRGVLNELTYDIDTQYKGNDALFAVTFKRGVAVLSFDVVHAVYAQSRTRVVDVHVGPQGNVNIVLVRENAPASQHVRTLYKPPTKRKQRHVACDYRAANVTSADDCANIDAIVDAVYHMRDRLPAEMHFWFEKIRGGSIGAEHNGAAIPLTTAFADADADESESVVGGVDVVGYALCFTNAGGVDGSFLAHLHATYPSVVVSSLVWIDVPAMISDEPMLVVNVRAATAVASDVNRHVLPKGVRVKRART